MVVSLESLMMWLELCRAVQSCQESEQQWAVNTALRSSCAKSDGVRGVAADSDVLRPI